MPSPDLSRFDGKIAVVTGAAQGIGEATARLFAERGVAGLLLTDRNAQNGRAVAAELSKAGTPAEFFPAELDDITQVQQIVPAADAHFGKVHILANVPVSPIAVRSGTPLQSSGTGCSPSMCGRRSS